MMSAVIQSKNVEKTGSSLTLENHWGKLAVLAASFYYTGVFPVGKIFFETKSPEAGEVFFTSLGISIGFTIVAVIIGKLFYAYNRHKLIEQNGSATTREILHRTISRVLIIFAGGFICANPPLLLPALIGYWLYSRNPKAKEAKEEAKHAAQCEEWTRRDSAPNQRKSSYTRTLEELTRDLGKDYVQEVYNDSIKWHIEGGFGASASSFPKMTAQEVYMINGLVEESIDEEEQLTGRQIRNW